MTMSGAETDSQDAWQETFFDKHDRTTPAPDYQPGWQLTAIGIIVGMMALLMLSA